MIWRQGRHNPILIEGEQCAALALAQNRLSILMAVFVAAFFVMGLRLVDLSVVKNTALFAQADVEDKEIVNDIAVRRGDVYDRNGFLLASSLKTPSLYVDPLLVHDVAGLADSLLAVFPDLNRAKVMKTLNAKNRFGWIQRHISPQEREQVMLIGSPALGFEYEYKRVYPQGELFSHMLGHVSRDGYGHAGAERGLNAQLAQGEDVTLSFDMRIQHVVRREILNAMNMFEAKAGTGVVMDAKTGALLAAVSLPDYDLNLAGQADDNDVFNRLTLGVYELGSMFKIFSTAAVLEFHDVDMAYTFDAREPIKAGRFRINDYHAQKRILTVPEVFMHSSNIGSAMMGRMVGGEALRKFYADLGLLDPMRFEVREVGKPLLPSVWGDVATMTASYGHGLATTPLQMTAAVASIVNGGYVVRPTIVKADSEGVEHTALRVISDKTSEDMRRLLRLNNVEGTGKNSDVAGFAVGGKTGTAEKIVNGRYDTDLLISSYVAAFPMDDPRYVVMVMVDEPVGQKHSYGYATAGWVAAPAVKNIVSGMAQVLGLPSDQYDAEQDIATGLLQHLHDEESVEKRRKQEALKKKQEQQSAQEHAQQNARGGKHLASY